MFEPDAEKLATDRGRPESTLLGEPMKAIPFVVGQRDIELVRSVHEGILA